MDYQIQLNNGQAINMKSVTDFDATAFTQMLNNREITFVNIAGAILNKNLIASITPTTTQA